MTYRRPDAILRDWRAAERDRAYDDENADLAARVEALRTEHGRALDARREVARDLGGTPEAQDPFGHAEATPGDAGAQGLPQP
jgi:hypothetical protein